MTGTPFDYTWGPSITADGNTRFRLWAPAHDSVKLRIGETDVAMTARDGGWFEAESRLKPTDKNYAFILPDGTRVPDPASRRQDDVLGMSTLVDSTTYEWEQVEWRGRPWEEAVFYELHIGAFTEQGTFRAAIARLASLADLGFTAIELMPVAHFPGQRGWGYDGVFQYAPHSAYGTADDFKALVDAAHQLGLMVFLDVVYNHFGPEGNFLSRYAPEFFLETDPTPWGPRIAFAHEPVRRFFIENALYWLTEFRLDGLRLDAVDQIEDHSAVHFLEQLSTEIHAAIADRNIHLITENPANGTDLMAAHDNGSRLFRADWNDDFHHALHVAVTGEASGFYAAFADHPWNSMAKALAEGYLMPGKQILAVDPPPTSALPTSCFVHYLQNHDQVGNRALGDRLHIKLGRNLYGALVEMLVLSPQIPLFFMGDDHLSTRPFRFFCDYEGQLRSDIWSGRFREADNFGGVPNGFVPSDIADPSDIATFEDCKLDWSESESPSAVNWQRLLKTLLDVRSTRIVPLTKKSVSAGRVLEAPERCVFVDWDHPDGVLKLRANLSPHGVPLSSSEGTILYPNAAGDEVSTLAGYSVKVFNDRRP